jgi:hypothetical protein
MAVFVPGQAVQTQDPSIEVTVSPASPLPPGKHRFQLVVVDDSGNQSTPAEAEVIVVDTQRPTAVIDAPRKVAFGSSFTLSGARSADVAPGRIVQYIWTRLA